jgi:hypothetical protein
VNFNRCIGNRGGPLFWRRFYDYFGLIPPVSATKYLVGGTTLSGNFHANGTS